MKSHNLKWTLHGEVEKTPLLAGTFARSGLHFLVGEDEKVVGAIVADLAAALTSGVATCGLGPESENGVRASLAGWMGRTCGAATGVAIVTQERRADALRRAVAASALARGVATPLPIAVTEVGGSEPLSTVPLRLRELASWLRAGRGVELGLVILDGLHFSGDRARDAALTLSLQAIESVGVAVLVVASELPAALVRESSVVVEVGSDRIGNADLWFRSNNMEMNPEQKWEYLLEQLGGATFGLAHQIYQGGVDVANGNVERGLEKMAPAFIKNPAKAVRYAMEGVQDKNENPIVEYVPWQDIMKQAAGFTPAEIRERMDRNTFQRNTQTRIHKEKSDALRAAGRARLSGDQSAIEAAQKKVDAYNADVPEARITPKSIMQEAKRFKKKHDRMELGVDLDPKLEDRIKEGTAPSIYAR